MVGHASFTDDSFEKEREGRVINTQGLLDEFRENGKNVKKRLLGFYRPYRCYK